MIQFLKCGQQISDRSASAIQAPYEHYIDLSTTRRFQQSLSRLSHRGTGADLPHF
jgi:hypothetical protein